MGGRARRNGESDIQDVAHKTFVLVDEEGTEAAAATGVIVNAATSVVPPPEAFTADRPFVYLIRDVNSGAILFLGRVTDASAGVGRGLRPAHARCFAVRSSTVKPRCLLVLTVAALVACRPSAPPKPPAEPTPTPTKPKVAIDEPAKPLTPEDAFAKALDATVLVTTAWGHGTGVLVEPSGFVLTNYHVIASGKNEDFGITATITLPKHNPDGSVSPGERFTAVAHAIDEKRDLALLKIQDPGREFPTLRITSKDARPGTKVFALGNAGVGLGWALKRCSVNAIGTLDEQVSAIFAMQRTDMPAEERARTEEAIRKTAADAGRQIQTDCNILPGDSGGPLVDEATGEVVGLNVAVRTALNQFVSLGSLAFHVHAVELRDFTKTLPPDSKSFLPDPWTAAGSFGQTSDSDLDGEIDTLGFAGPCGENLMCQVALGDLDENSFRGKTVIPTATDLQTSRKFDAEVAVFRLARLPRKPTAFAMPVSDMLVYVDGDDDGTFEKLIVADGETGGTRGYVFTDGRATREPTLDGVALIDIGTLLSKEKLRPEATRFVAAVATGVVELSDPQKMQATKASLEDNNKDGSPDTLRIETRLDRRVLIDIDQKQLAAVVARQTKVAGKGARAAAGSNTALLRSLRTGKLQGDVLVVLGAPTRVFYDTDANGVMDLVLEGASLESGVALSAAAIDAQGRLSPATEHLGRLLLRPALVKDPKAAALLATIYENAFVAAPRASIKDDASSFPPAMPTKAMGVSQVGTFGDHVISVFDGDSVVILADLDKNALRGKKAKTTVAELVGAGKFDAEFALRFGNGVIWSYYDSNDDGRFDRVSIAGANDPKTVVKAYKLSKTGVERDPTREGGAMIDPKLAHGAAAQKMLGEVAAILGR